jgi:hypothetical protein
MLAASGYTFEGMDFSFNQYVCLKANSKAKQRKACIVGLHTPVSLPVTRN